jgi:hypothetical protein
LAYSAIKKNEIMSFAGKWMELEIILLREISQAQEAKHCIFYSFLKSRPQMMMMMIIIIMGQECKRGTVWEGKSAGGGRRN